MIPGVNVLHPTKLPHVQGDLIFALALGFALSLIYPIIKLFRLQLSIEKIAAASGALSLLSYAILNFLPVDIKVESFSGYFWASVLVFLSGFLTNYLEYKKQIPKEVV